MKPKKQIMPESLPQGEEIEDSEYSRKSEFSKPVLAQAQISKCLDLRSRDMRPGYTSFFLDKDGNSKPQIVPDSRKEFIASVDALKNLLAPEIEKDFPEMKEQYETAKKKAFDKYAWHETIGREWGAVDGEEKAFWVYSGKVYMPHKGHNIMCLGKKPKSVDYVYSPAWDGKIDAYWDEILTYADELFEELNKLIHSLDYFEGKSSW